MTAPWGCHIRSEGFCFRVLVCCIVFLGCHEMFKVGDRYPGGDKARRR